MKKIIFGLCLIFGNLFLANSLLARTQITDWYIKDFQSEIVVNKDSTLLVTEKIVADCGQLPDKHGIFRTLPTVFKTQDQEISMPVELVEITDFKGKSLKYTTQRDYSNDTITWKIGDPDVTVSGENEYQIVYRVKNVILFDNLEFDEFYWNLSGNFWDLEIDNFSTKIIFPQEVDKEDVQLSYYVGGLGNKEQEGAEYLWEKDNVLGFNSTRTFLKGEGITASATFPKGVFVPYQPTFWEKYELFIWLIIPVVVFLVTFNFWKKYGKDPRIDKTIIPEFSVPGKLSPLDLGVLLTNGKLKNEFISASIVNLAVQKIIQIKETTGGFLGWGKDYELIVIDKDRVATLAESEKKLFSELFDGKMKIKLSSLKNRFYLSVPKIKKVSLKDLEKKELIKKTGLTFQVAFLAGGFICIFSMIFGAVISPLILPALFLSAIFFFIFSFLMPQRTPQGAELNWQIKGFKLYMETAEKYRAQFNEKENIFEKFLPYAIMFGMTKLWVKKMKDIYGEDYFLAHQPVWFIGSSLESFDVESFSSRLDSLSSAISSNASSGSGAAGGGSSGGGGGGGGGGGW